MNTVIAKMQEQLEALKERRDMIEATLAANGEIIIARLEALSQACLRECYQVKSNGDIADGEIQVRWDLLQENIAWLRQIQKEMRRSTDQIHDCEADLLEAEHPF